MLLEDFNEDEFVNLVDKKEKSEGQGTSNWHLPPAVEIAGQVSKEHPKGFALVRLINANPSTPTDPGTPGSGRAKLCNIAMIKDSKDNWHHVVLPAYIKWKSMYPSIFLDFIDKVLSKSKMEVNGETKWIPVYAERDDRGAYQGSNGPTLAEIYKMVNTSGQEQKGEIKPKTWRGSTVYIVNCFDRTDPKWHKEHKSTKLLISKITKKGEKTYYKELPWYCIQNGLDGTRTSYENTPYKKFHCDLFIEPGASGTDSYKFTNASKAKDTGFIDEMKIPAEYLKNISVDPNLTQEEMECNTIDIDKEYAFTPASQLISWFGDIIGAFDSYEGTNYLGKLKEEAKYEAKTANVPETKLPSDEPKVETKVEAPKAEPIPEVKQPEPIQSIPSFDKLEDANPTPVKAEAPSMDDFWNTLGDDEKD